MSPPVRIRIVDSPADLDACLRIRRTVFIEGQGVPEREEFDGLDDGCAHFIAEAGTGPVGTVRLRITPGGDAKLERLAVLGTHEGRGIGSLLAAALEDLARGMGHDEVVLGAQVQALGFYEKLGYAAEGPVYQDAGIPHRLMRKRILGRDG